MPETEEERDWREVNYPALLPHAVRSVVEDGAFRGLPHFLSRPHAGRGAVHNGKTGTRRGFLRGFLPRGQTPKPSHPTLIPGVLGPFRGRHRPRVEGRSTAAPPPGPFWPPWSIMKHALGGEKCCERASSPPYSLRSLRKGPPRYRTVNGTLVFRRENGSGVEKDHVQVDVGTSVIECRRYQRNPVTDRREDLTRLSDDAYLKPFLALLSATDSPNLVDLDSSPVACFDKERWELRQEGGQWVLVKREAESRFDELVLGSTDTGGTGPENGGDEADV